MDFSTNFTVYFIVIPLGLATLVSGIILILPTNWDKLHAEACVKWKTEIQKNKLEQRLEKVEMQLKLQKNTRDYNLGTSLRNYVDPRVMKAWMAHVGLDWKKIYTSTLQRKFRWVEEYNLRELRAFYPSAKRMQDTAVEVVQEES